MLEKMSDFFEARLSSYDEHMLTEIDFATEFYPFTANLLPKNNDAKILDLGCGTGLELGFYFKQNPEAEVTGIDLCEAMLESLKEKFIDKKINIIVGSYFEVPFIEEKYDAAVSVESLHHFTKSEKIPLYNKLNNALKEGGYFILTDYFALSQGEENMHREILLRLKREQNISDNEFYHYDTPLTVENETNALLNAGFSKVEVLNNWGQTYTLKAYK